MFKSKLLYFASLATLLSGLLEKRLFFKPGKVLGRLVAGGNAGSSPVTDCCAVQNRTPYGVRKMTPNSVILKFEEVAEQVAFPVMRIVGFAKARDLLQLFDAADLEANPRAAKAGPVTEEIMESILDTPDIFVFKTKGLLIGSSNCEKLQRNRYRLTFENTRIEGILDGGHNTLAIGTHILKHAVGSHIEKKVRRWADFKNMWDEHRDEVEELRMLKPDDEGYQKSALDFLVPLEILVPSDSEDEESLEAFNTSLLAICSARNNNVQLTPETKSNKKGFFEELRAGLPEEIQERVEWKTNAGGDIKARDLVALAWIPLSVLDLDGAPSVAPQSIYSNKGECVKLYDDLMSAENVSKATDGDYIRKIFNGGVISALKLAGELPELYDKIYRDLPQAWNANDGKFGKITYVKTAASMKTKPTAYFTGSEVKFSYPDGYIIPLVYGLRSLMVVNTNGTVQWTRDPYEFLDDHLTVIVSKFRLILDAFHFDPQKVGKHGGSYQLVLDAYKTELALYVKS